jgi:hypothetical protein
MTTFDEREQAFERRYVHDEDMRFRTTARRNKLLGLWAAEKLGKTGAEADAYAKEVVLVDFQTAGEEDVVRKVAGDLADKGVDEAEVRATMGRLLAKAKEDVAAGR